MFRILSALVLCCTATFATAQNASVAGAITTPHPTQRNLSIEWAYSGDANANARVSVRYRKLGNPAWRNGPALRRTPAGSNEGFSWGSRHSGSVFDLVPATSYEIELTLVDPDGGGSTETIEVATRAIPSGPASPNLIAVTPGTFAAAASAADPGDVLVLGTGNYAGFTFDRDGAPGNPIVIRGSAGAIVQGEIGLFFRHDLHIENLEVHGRIRFNGSDRIVIRGCTVIASPSQFNGDGIVSYLRAEDAWIADNTVVGTTPWQESAMGADGDNRGEGILVTGPGHVIEHNRVSGFRDGISFLEGNEAVDQFSIDVIGNEISESLDDAIEADFCAHNCRMLRNRSTNAFIAFSSQPGLGGPTWFVRNSAYNVAHVAFKLYRGSTGDVLLHNTVIKAGDALGMYPGVPISRLHARNNLLLGGAGGVLNGYGNGSGDVARIEDLVSANSSLDYNAYGSSTGEFAGRLGAVSFDSLAELNSLTSEVHAVETDLSTFAQTVTDPADPLQQSPAVDLRLASGGSAVDVGEIIAGINESYSGVAPDAGAHERGAPLPVYGPRGDLIFADGWELPGLR